MDAAALRTTSTRVASGLVTELRAARRLYRAGVIPAASEFPTVIKAAREAGGAAITDVLAARYSTDVAVIDGETELTYRDLADRTRRWINVLNGLDVAGDRPTVGVMCRNSAPLIVGLLGAMSAGVRLVFLNTDMGRSQLVAVCEREKIDVLLHDDEFTQRVDAATDCRKILAKHCSEAGGASARETMDALIDAASNATPPRAARQVEMVILTSGSSGTPRGAARSSSQKTIMSTMAGLLEKIPLTRTDVIYLAPPAFHGWGLIATLVGLMSGATLVFDGRFNAERAVETMINRRCTVFVAVPTMLSRVMALPRETLAPLVGGLRIIGSGGARLEPGLVVEIGETFGRVLHNLYGATELSYITIATPADLAVDPTCAGSPPLGVTLAIVTEGRRAGAGELGEIYVRTPGQMTSYTDGTTKETFEGMARTGDTGYVDAAGRLFVRGRADGMIVSGGENVYPEEVELALQRHPGLADATVFAVSDKDFGQRLAAIVSRAGGSSISVEEIKDYVGQELSRSRVPRDVIVVEEIARTSTGKVTRDWRDSVIAGD